MIVVSDRQAGRLFEQTDRHRCPEPSTERVPMLCTPLYGCFEPETSLSCLETENPQGSEIRVPVVDIQRLEREREDDSVGFPDGTGVTWGCRR